MNSDVNTSLCLEKYMLYGVQLKIVLPIIARYWSPLANAGRYWYNLPSFAVASVNGHHWPLLAVIGSC